MQDIILNDFNTKIVQKYKNTILNIQLHNHLFKLPLVINFYSFEISLRSSNLFEMVKNDKFDRVTPIFM